MAIKGMNSMQCHVALSCNIKPKEADTANKNIWFHLYKILKISKSNLWVSQNNGCL